MRVSPVRPTVRSPQSVEHVFTLPPSEWPKGMLARGSYTMKGRVRRAWWAARVRVWMTVVAAGRRRRRRPRGVCAAVWCVQPPCRVRCQRADHDRERAVRRYREGLGKVKRRCATRDAVMCRNEHAARAYRGVACGPYGGGPFTKSGLSHSCGEGTTRSTQRAREARGTHTHTHTHTHTDTNTHTHTIVDVVKLYPALLADTTYGSDLRCAQAGTTTAEVSASAVGCARP